MARKLKATPMETQPIRSQVDVATPMASIMSKPSKATQRPNPQLRRAKLPRQGGTLKKQRSMLRD